MKLATGVILAVLLAAAGSAQAQPGQKAGSSVARMTAQPEGALPPDGSVSSASFGKADAAAGSAIAGIASALLFAPAFAGDGQTANWRIISRNQAAGKPWTAIGNFLIPGVGGYCSAALVAPRVVLTANHCLYAPDYNKRDARGHPGRQLMDATRFVFVAGVHDGTFVDSVPVEAVIAGGWTPGSEEPAKDWAIAILARPASDEIVPLAFRHYNPSAAVGAWRNKLVVAAYPGASFAFSSVLRLSFNCSILEAGSAKVLAHDCQSEYGSSGGPILVEENGELKLIGIHSSRRVHSQARNGVSINGFLAQLTDAVARFQ